jgi:uncharacterized membrane protein (UPF0182 family)
MNRYMEGKQDILHKMEKQDILHKIPLAVSVPCTCLRSFNWVVEGSGDIFYVLDSIFSDSEFFVFICPMLKHKFKIGQVTLS